MYTNTSFVDNWRQKHMINEQQLKQINALVSKASMYLAFIKSSHSFVECGNMGTLRFEINGDLVKPIVEKLYYDALVELKELGYEDI